MARSGGAVDFISDDFLCFFGGIIIAKIDSVYFFWLIRLLSFQESLLVKLIN